MRKNTYVNVQKNYFRLFIQKMTQEYLLQCQSKVCSLNKICLLNFYNTYFNRMFSILGQHISM